MSDNIWANIEKAIAEDKEDYKQFTPIWCLPVGNVLVSLERTPELVLEVLETHPYAFDGSIPITFIQIAWLQFTVEWKWLYKILYKRKYGYLPTALDPEVK